MRETAAQQPATAATIGNGSALHAPYYSTSGSLLGSLCNPYAWERSRVRLAAAAPTCPRCAKATNRAAEQL
jgi:hypothetical protein